MRNTIYSKVLVFFWFTNLPALLCSRSEGTVYTKLLSISNPSTNRTNCFILSQEVLQKVHLFNDVEAFVEPAIHSNPLDLADSDKKHSEERNEILEFFSPAENNNTFAHISKKCDKVSDIENSIFRESKALTNKIMKIVNSGDSRNRIDVVFMGDGYTEKERGKFFSDVNRLVNETFYSSTYSEFLPILNIWAIFTPSPDSGITYPGKRKNTAFRLYRNSGILRGILVGNPARARATCRMIGVSACDFPVIVANDDFYGGIGGEFAVTTSSITSGSLVLRHELGHNFARVGEEYDRGEVYVGVNTAPSLRNVGWRAWLSNNGSKTVREERMTYRILKFPQMNLERSPKMTIPFRSEGKFGGWNLQVTLAGAKEQDSVQFFLDGEKLPWTSKGTLDKTIYSWTNSTQALSRGMHNLTITAPPRSQPLLKPLPHEMVIPRSIGSAFFYEFGNESDFHSDNKYVSAYPTWNVGGRKSFRPTFNGCLMRNMTHDQLCSVCKESVWLQFLRRVSLIDDLIFSNGPNKNETTVTFVPLKLGQFRESDPILGEKMEIRWTRDGKLQEDWNDKLKINAVKGRWVLEVRLITPRIRNDPRGLTKERRAFPMS